MRAIQKMSSWRLTTAIFEEQETSFENILKGRIEDRYNCLKFHGPNSLLTLTPYKIKLLQWGSMGYKS